MPNRITTFHCLLLQSFDRGETSRISRSLSADHGLLSLSFRGSRKGVLPIPGDTLCLLEVTADLKDGADIAGVREVTLLDDFSWLKEDLERLAVAMVLSEVAAQNAQPAVPCPNLFASLLMGFRELAPGDRHPAMVGCLGLLGVLTASGLGPRLDTELLKPWPADRPKPCWFALNLTDATIRFPATEAGVSPAWPVVYQPGSQVVALPPSGVRLCHDFILGRQADFGSPKKEEALAMFEGLVLLAENLSGSRLRCDSFWRPIMGA